jgi:hypothetical protein
VSAYVPRLQLTQVPLDEAPEAELDEPTGHDWQSVAATMGLYLPVRHSVQSVADVSDVLMP